MSLTLQSVVTELLAIPSPGERLPLDLLRSLVRDGWRDLAICPACGMEFCQCAELGRRSEPQIVLPAWGLGVICGRIAVANHGASGLTIPDPADKRWAGPPHKSGKHDYDGSSRYPYGGLGWCHLDSGGLLDAYERWGDPAGGVFHPGVYVRAGKPVAFDTLRREGGVAWRVWLDWADALLARTEFHEWLAAYWLREYWAPSWVQSAWSVERDLVLPSATSAVPVSVTKEAGKLSTIRRACMNARIRNSAKSWAAKWAHLPADEQAKRYVEAKREARGDAAAKRTERQVRYALRAAAAIEAVRVEVMP